MKNFLEYLDSHRVDYTVVEDDIVDIKNVGLVMFADIESKRSVFRMVDFGDEKSIYLNIFETKGELVDMGIKLIAFMFGGSWNYIDMDDEDIKFHQFLNVGVSKEPQCGFDYVNLGVRTRMDLLNGSGSPDEWVQRAAFLGHKYIGISDFNTLANTLKMQIACSKAGIQHIFGYSTRIDMVSHHVNIKLYAHTDKGFNNLLRIHKGIAVDRDDEMIGFNELIKYGKDVSLVIGKSHGDWLINGRFYIEKLKEHFNEVYFQVDLNEYRANRIDESVLISTKTYFNEVYKKDKYVKPILLPDTFYTNKELYRNKEILNRIDSGAAHNQSNSQWYKSIDEIREDMKPLFEKNWDVDEILKECADNSVMLAETCNASYKMDKNYMPQYDLTEEEVEKYGNAENMFDQLLEEGLMKLAPKDRIDEYRERMEMEKYVIKSTDNVNYMLNQYDMVNYAVKNDILVGVGRGSAGGSLILYLLGVTKIDPIRFSLLFERFLLPERAGLYESTVTKIDREVDDSPEVVDIEFEDGRSITVDIDSLFVLDGKDDRATYADELKEGDTIVFDNIHKIFDIKKK